jgi:hypothetical protein
MARRQCGKVVAMYHEGFRRSSAARRLPRPRSQLHRFHFGYLHQELAGSLEGMGRIARLLRVGSAKARLAGLMRNAIFFTAGITHAAVQAALLSRRFEGQ